MFIGRWEATTISSKNRWPGKLHANTQKLENIVNYGRDSPISDNPVGRNDRMNKIGCPVCVYIANDNTASVCVCVCVCVLKVCHRMGVNSHSKRNDVGLFWKQKI